MLREQGYAGSSGPLQRLRDPRQHRRETGDGYRHRPARPGNRRGFRAEGGRGDRRGRIPQRQIAVSSHAGCPGTLCHRRLQGMPEHPPGDLGRIRSGEPYLSPDLNPGGGGIICPTEPPGTGYADGTPACMDPELFQAVRSFFKILS